MRRITKDKLTKAGVEIPQSAALVLPEPPYLDGDTVTAAGLVAIEMLAANAAPQQKIASVLGVSLAMFKRDLLGKASDNPMTPTRAAYERGRGDLEAEVAGLLLKAARNGNTIAAIFFSKAQ